VARAGPARLRAGRAHALCRCLPQLQPPLQVVPPTRGSEDRALQRRILQFLAAQLEWRRPGGRDHVVLTHHPNGMLDARYKLRLGAVLELDEEHARVVRSAQLLDFV
jgi:hypothetical protein